LKKLFFYFVESTNMAACGFKSEAKEEEEPVNLEKLVTEMAPKLKPDFLTEEQKARAKAHFDMFINLKGPDGKRVSDGKQYGVKEHAVWLQMTCKILGQSEKEEKKRVKSMTEMLATLDPKDEGMTLEKQNFILNYGLQIPEFLEVFKQQAKLQFNLLDADGDGLITKEEYRAVLIPMGRTKEDIDYAHKEMDTNGDGKLSPEEFSTAFLNYWTQKKNDHTSRHLWGKWPWPAQKEE